MLPLPGFGVFRKLWISFSGTPTIRMYYMPAYIRVPCLGTLKQVTKLKACCMLLYTSNFPKLS